MQYRNRIGNNKSDLITMLFIFAKEKIKQFNNVVKQVLGGKINNTYDHEKFNDTNC